MSDVYGTVNGVSITDADVDAFINKLPQEQKAYLSDPGFRKHCAQQLLEKEMFFASAQEDHLDETEEFKEAIANTSKDLLARMAVNRLLGSINATEEEMRSYYEQNKDKFMKESVASAKHILVAEEALCQKIKEDIANNKISFEDAAREHSTCPSREKGGDLGTFGKGQMVPEFDKVVFSENLNEVHGPVKTQFGYHLILIENRTDASVVSYEAAKPQVQYSVINDKREDAYKAKIEELEKKFCS